MNSYSQNDSSSFKRNIVYLKAGTILYADDRVVSSERDTVIILPINIDYYIKRRSNSKSDKFYELLQERAYKRKWTKEIHNIIIAESNTEIKDTVQTQKSEISFLKYQNLIIRNINIKKLDVFGPSIYEPEKKPRTWVGGVLNKSHIKTNNQVIENHLLFKKGDLIDPYTLADNERILRELLFIEDARIFVDNISESGDSADITVMTKDNWSLGLDFTTKDFNNLYFDVWDNNILGSGQGIDNLVYRNPGKMPYSGIDGHYLKNNITGSFINCRIDYSLYDKQGVKVSFWRNFFTQRTKYAGALSFENMKTYGRIENNNIFEYQPLTFTKTDFWIGRAFPFNIRILYNTNISNVTLAGGIYNSHFTVGPVPAADKLFDYQNRTLYLTSLAFSNQGYFKSNLVYNYGRTEDIPYGTLIKFTYGIDKNEFSQRLYQAISFSKGNYLFNIGYVYANISFGGFLKKGIVEQGVLKLSGNFFSNLLVVGSFKMRHFVNITFTKGYKRFNDEYLYINDLSGIRGFENDSVKGTQKLVANLESVCFTPLYIAGFRYAFFAFADLGLVGPTYKSVFVNHLYSSYGIGIRIRNERFVFKTFQIRLAYYPGLPKSTAGEFLNVSEDSKFRPQNFYVKSPEVVRFD
jgi:hypothetical protein